MELKPGYKQTEVGVIPEDWEVKPLKYLISISHGFAFESRYFANSGSSYRLTTPGHFYEEGGFKDISEKQRFYIGEIPVDYVFHPGDLIVAMTEQADGLLGSAAFIPGEGYLHNQRIGRIRPLSTDINLAYLFFIFNSARYRAKVCETAAGTKVKHTSPEKLLEIAIQLPPASEQRAIATALSDMDELLGALDRLIAKKRDLKQAAMQQLLTGQRRLPGFESEWKVKRIADIAVSVSEKNLMGDTLPVLTCSKHLGFVDSLGFFKNQVFSKDLSTYKIIKKGQIGYPANHVEEGSIGLQDIYDVALVSPIYIVFSVTQDINSFFLHRLLKLDSYRQKFKTATTSSVDRRGSLRWPAFSEIKVAFPTLSEQNAIVTVLSDMEDEIAALEQRRDKTRALKQAMMQELLTGKTRLVSPGEVYA